MAYYIFLKSLRGLGEFRKNPHVKIPPKSPCANFQSLGKFKNPIFNSEILFPYFRPGRPCGPLGARRWRLCGSTFSLLVHAFRAGCFPLVSLSSWPRLSAPSLTSGCPSSAAPPPPPSHPASSSSAPRVPPSHYHPAFISPPP
jgi:hypothetical protein